MARMVHRTSVSCTPPIPCFQVDVFEIDLVFAARIIMTNGFDERVTSLKGLYGAAVYFAEASSKADAYAGKVDGKSNGIGSQGTLFLSRVALGTPHLTDEPLQQIRRPPTLSGLVDKPGAPVASTERRCDSVVASKKSGHDGSPYREFMIYDRRQIYGEFMVQYTRGASSARTPKVVSLEDDAINLTAVMRALNDPLTLALRLHGSKKAQHMLSQVQSEHDLAVLQDVGLPPVVVLTTGSLDNTRECAIFLLDAWLPKEKLAGYQKHINPNWFVSNHTSAVSLNAIDVELKQENLPAGCVG